MYVLKRILKGIGRQLVLFFFTAGILLAASVYIFTSTFGDRSTVLQWPVTAGTYQELPRVAFDLVETGAIEQGTFIVDPVKIRETVEASYDAAFLQSQAEEIINGTFDWLDGTTDKPIFSVSLGGQAKPFIENLTVVFQEHVASLPDCTGATSAFDLTTSPCKPPGFDPEAEIRAYNQELADFVSPGIENEALLTSEYTGDDLLESLGPDVDLPAWLGWAKLAQTGGLLLAFAMGALFFFINGDRTKALRRLGVSTLSTSVSLIIGLLLLQVSKFVRNNLYETLPDEQVRNVAQTVLEPLADAVVASVTNRTLWVIGIIVGLGVILLIVAHRLKMRHLQVSVDPSA